MLAYNSRVFFKTGLGDVYEKCTNDAKFTYNIKCKFDVKNGFTNYDGTGLLSHYHEAAYDAQMTAMAYIHILKFKEIEFLRNMNKGKGGKQKKADANEPAEKPEDKKNKPVSEKSHFANTWMNRLMMDHYGSDRYYHFDPFKYKMDFESRQTDGFFSKTCHITFEDKVIENLTAGAISSLFESYGDFYVYRDSMNSIYLEFFLIDKKSVPEGTLTAFCKTVLKTPELKVIAAVVHEDAPKFVAHSNFDGGN